MLKKSLSILLSALLLLGVCAGTALATDQQTLPADNPVSPRYVDLQKVEATLTISSTGMAKATCIASAKSKSDIDVTVYLQKKVGTKWINVDSWSISQKGVLKASVSGNCQVEKGSTYRSYAVAYVNGEKGTGTSSTKTY